jgi:hypothetical protein
MMLHPQCLAAGRRDALEPDPLAHTIVSAGGIDA